jgi:transcriptional regulator of arginine metabolism
MPAEAEIRQKRQDAILEILRQQPVARQTQLVELLHDQGIEATQSSVSRDLKQLGVAKLENGYAQFNAQSDNPTPDLPLLEEFVRDIKTAGPNLTVINTSIGAAQRVAVFLDRAEWPEVVGTLSGDDTIFIATQDGNAQRRLVARLRSQFDH